MKKKIVDVYIDADSIAYTVAPTPIPKKDSLEGVAVSVVAPKFSVYKKEYKDRIQEAKDEAAVEFALRGWKLGKVHVILSDPNGSFRNEIYPEYKANRKGQERTKAFYKVKKWSLKKFGYVKGFEADDIVAYHVKRGAVGFSIDKDLLYGVEGLWYNSHHKHSHWVDTTAENAEKFNYHQTLAGDLTDNIKGINRVALPTAEKLMDGEYTWDQVVKVYLSKNMTIADAVLTRRLIGMDQVVLTKKGKYKLKLWEAPKLSQVSVGAIFKKVHDEVITTSNKSSKTDSKKVEETKTSRVKRPAKKRKVVSVPESDSSIQSSASDNTKKRYSGYYKSCYAHKNLIHKNTYNKLSRDQQREYTALEI